VTALALRVLPQRLAAARQDQIILGAQQNEMIDDRRFAVPARELDFEILRLAAALA